MNQSHLNVDKVEKYDLLPGDPDRIDKILKYLDDGREISLKRGLRISEGDYNGVKISCVSTGMGCPSAAIVVEELSKVGAEIVIRIGTCGGLLKEMRPGDIIIPESAFCGDGTSKEYDGNIKNVKANEKVVNALVEAAKKKGVRYFVGVNRTHDAFYEPIENFLKLAGQGFISSEMECSSVFLVSKLRNLKAGAILVVNTPEPPEEVSKDPNSIYQLVDEKKVSEGMENAIKIALDAAQNLSGR